MNTRQAEDAVAEHRQEVESKAGQDMLVAQVSHITNQVESIAIERIDTVINRLMNLKAKIIADNKDSIERTTKFIFMVDGGMREVEKLESLVERLETTATR